ncbi:hypothetical protein [uncultured Tateyamaria sp.]|uniref:hypothetical protein n=1 Tax=uncultured Tateyamaria sp. TaxID=455651 RepID=UPI002611E49E|nr:hypothetical protein [uncultured Tateyamaria sp.]
MQIRQDASDQGVPQGSAQRQQDQSQILLQGPAALSYDNVAKILRDALSRPVTHHHLSLAELAKRHMAARLPEAYATTLATMDADIAVGSEDRVTDAVMRVTGHPPRSLLDFIADHTSVWRRGVEA